MDKLKQFFAAAFAKMLSAVKYVFTPEGQKKASEAIGKAEGLVHLALPVVETIAKLTPTKADDEILAVVHAYCESVELPAGPLTDQQKGDLLFQSAFTAVKNMVKGQTGITDSVIDLAVQFAYTAFRAATR